MNDVDLAKSAKLEKQVLELWDRLYQAWMSSDDSQGPKVTSAAVQHSWDAFIDDIQKSPGMQKRLLFQKDFYFSSLLQKCLICKE